MISSFVVRKIKLLKQEIQQGKRQEKSKIQNRNRAEENEKYHKY